MIHVEKSFRYTTETGHIQRIGEGTYNRLPEAALAAGRAAKAIRDTTESKKASRRRTKG